MICIAKSRPAGLRGQAAAFGGDGIVPELAGGSSGDGGCGIKGDYCGDGGGTLASDYPALCGAGLSNAGYDLEGLRTGKKGAAFQ